MYDILKNDSVPCIL